MDQTAILKILQDNGAQPTLENINRLMQSSQMYGRALGLQGGMDESGPTPLMLDKLVRDTSTPAQMPIAPNSESNGAAQNGAAVSDAPSRSPVVRPPAVPRVVTQGSGIDNTGSAAPDLQRTQARNELNRVIAGDTTVNTGTPTVDNTAVAFPNTPISMQDYALAVGGPPAAAAVGYALYQRLAALDGTVKMQPGDLGGINQIANGPRAMEMGDLFRPGQDPASIRKMIDEVAAENAALGLGPKPPPTGAGNAAVDKVAADTAAKPPLDTKTRALPRTAVEGVVAGPNDGVVGPPRPAPVVNDPRVRAEKAASDAALKGAQKPQSVPPARDTGPVSSIKDLPYSPPVDPNAIPSKGPVEPMPNKSSSTLKALIEAVKRGR